MVLLIHATASSLLKVFITSLPQHRNPAESFLFPHIEPHRKKLTYYMHVGLRVQVKPCRGERTAPGQGQGQKQLIGQMFAHRCTAREVRLRLAGGIAGNVFRADPTLAEGSKD